MKRRIVATLMLGLAFVSGTKAQEAPLTVQVPLSMEAPSPYSEGSVAPPAPPAPTPIPDPAAACSNWVPCAPCPTPTPCTPCLIPECAPHCYPEMGKICGHCSKCTSQPCPNKPRASRRLFDWSLDDWNPGEKLGGHLGGKDWSRLKGWFTYRPQYIACWKPTPSPYLPPLYQYFTCYPQKKPNPTLCQNCKGKLKDKLRNKIQSISWERPVRSQPCQTCGRGESQCPNCGSCVDCSFRGGARPGWLGIWRRSWDPYPPPCATGRMNCPQVTPDAAGVPGQVQPEAQAPSQVPVPGFQPGAPAPQPEAPATEKEGKRIPVGLPASYRPRVAVSLDRPGHR